MEIHDVKNPLFIHFENENYQAVQMQQAFYIKSREIFKVGDKIYKEEEKKEEKKGEKKDEKKGKVVKFSGKGS